MLIDDAGTPDQLAAMIERRVAGLPLEQILGWAEFRGLRIALDPRVFVPRRRTEFLVEQAVALLRRATGDATPPAVVVDLCCGSGAVGVALAAVLNPIELHAVEIDPVAVRCAARNLAPVGGRVYHGDLYDPLPAALRGRIDLLAVNAPYVPTGDISLMPPEARLHEPQVALDGGPDGLDIQRRVAAGAPGWLAPGGHLLIETSERQQPTTAAIFTGSGLLTGVARSEDFDATVVIGTRPRPAARRAGTTARRPG